MKVVWKLFQSKKIIFAILALKNFHWLKKIVNLGWRHLNQHPQENYLKKYRYYINYREQIITKISDDNNFCCYRQWLWLNVVAVSTSWRGSKFWASCRLFWPSCRQSPQLCPLFWMVLEVILDCLALDWAPRVTSCSSWLPRRGNAFYCCHGHYFNCFALFTFFNYLPYVKFKLC